MTERECPLTPRQLRMLQVCAYYRTTSSKELARRLDISQNTVRAVFTEIHRRLGVHSRGVALALCIYHGWLDTGDPAEDYLDGGAEHQPLYPDVDRRVRTGFVLYERRRGRNDQLHA